MLLILFLHLKLFDTLTDMLDTLFDIILIFLCVLLACPSF